MARVRIPTVRETPDFSSTYSDLEPQDWRGNLFQTYLVGLAKGGGGLGLSKSRSMELLEKIEEGFLEEEEGNTEVLLKGKKEEKEPPKSESSPRMMKRSNLRVSIE